MRLRELSDDGVILPSLPIAESDVKYGVATGPRSRSRKQQSPFLVQCFQSKYSVGTRWKQARGKGKRTAERPQRIGASWRHEPKQGRGSREGGNETGGPRWVSPAGFRGTHTLNGSDNEQTLLGGGGRCHDVYKYRVSESPLLLFAGKGEE